MEWKAEIEKTANGYILMLHDEYDDGTPYVIKAVFGQAEHPDNEVGCFIDLVWELSSYFSEQGTDFDKERFWVGMKAQGEA